MQNLLFGKGSLFKIVLATVFLMFSSHFFTEAQTIISSTGSFTNDTTVNTVTFNFQNTNTYSVIITNVDGILADYGPISTSVWYKTNAINGNPGNIESGNGWVMFASGNLAGIANAVNNVTQPMFNGLNLIIPAGTTYGIAITASGTNGRALRVGHGLTTFSIGAGGCNVISGANSGYGSMAPPPAAPNFSPIAWLGKITFAPVVACTGIPAAATISGPLNVCSNALFTLTSTPYPAGTTISYQWQKYNGVTLAWEDITSETSISYNCISGIIAATQFRLKTSCPSSSTPSYSNILTVNIGSGLPGGVYTINNNAQSSATNFVSFSAAAAAMKCGIAGPVTLNVDPDSGPYTEQVTFNNIPGTSNINKIRINGNGRILQYASTVNINPGILNMNGTKFMTVDSLTVRSLSLNLGIGISLADTAKYDSISHCFIDMRSLNSTAASSTVGISLSNNFYSFIAFSQTEYSYVGYNYILGSNGLGGPYYGITDYFGYNTNQVTINNGNAIVYNKIENFGNTGIISNVRNGSVIAYNDIHRTNKAVNSNFLGIRCLTRDHFVSGIPTGINDKVKIIGNRIHNPTHMAYTNIGFVGIQIEDDWYSSNSISDVNDGSNILIANNAIYNVNSNSAPILLAFIILVETI